MKVKTTFAALSVFAASILTLVLLGREVPGHTRMEAQRSAAAPQKSEEKEKATSEKVSVVLEALRREIEVIVADGFDDNEACGPENVLVYIPRELVSTIDYNEIQRGGATKKVHLYFIGKAEYEQSMQEHTTTACNIVAVLNASIQPQKGKARVTCRRRIYDDDPITLEYEMTLIGGAWAAK